ncbi:hypothetical protein NP493_712g00007 [Ridgeia piscesae]|uniref:Uncharacterized protein n=1 Tax=Ridgeia piscesae TaxID=27915 RepID=A0AAD9NQH3_RIDPI|nr:hypothetical protein NP493_712g00007 [Ridgeia piscesae]
MSTYSSRYSTARFLKGVSLAFGVISRSTEHQQLRLPMSPRDVKWSGTYDLNRESIYNVHFHPNSSLHHRFISRVHKNVLQYIKCSSKPSLHLQESHCRIQNTTVLQLKFTVLCNYKPKAKWSHIPC